MNNILFWLFMCLVLFSYILQDYGIKYDSTDSSKLEKRSGLSLYTDYGTGLQYIKGGLFGDIIPRLDENGTHMNIKEIGY